jgi:hypothetical protein
MAHASLAHLKEAMKYCFGTPNRGLLLKPMMKWDKDSNFEFKITGRSYSDFTKDPEGHQSVSGYSTFLCGASVTTMSRMQGSVTLDVMSSGDSMCARNVIQYMRVLESMGLKVKRQ